MTPKSNLRIGMALLALTPTLGACSRPLSGRERGTLYGGGAGAAGGALVGAMTGAPGTGALVGGAAGAAGGALLGEERDDD